MKEKLLKKKEETKKEKKKIIELISKPFVNVL